MQDNASQLLELGFEIDSQFYRSLAIKELFLPGIIATSIGYSDADFNIVLQPAAFKHEVEHLIETVINFYRQENVSWTWPVACLARQYSLAKFFVKFALQSIEYSFGMYVDLSRASLLSIARPNWQIREASSDNHRSDWLMLYVRAFFSDEAEKIEKCGQLFFNSLTKKTNMRHFVGYFHEQPIATITLFLGNSATMIANLSIAPAVRGQGFGKAMLLYAMQISKALGYNYSFLESAEENKVIYQKVGFQIYRTSEIFSLAGNLGVTCEA